MLHAHPSAVQRVLSSACRPVARLPRSALGHAACVRSGERGEARVLGGVLEADGLALGPRGEGVGAQLALAGGAAEAVHVPHAARAAVVSFPAQAAKSNAGGRLGHRVRGAPTTHQSAASSLKTANTLVPHLAHLVASSLFTPCGLYLRNGGAQARPACGAGSRAPAAARARTRARIRTRSPAASCWFPCAWAAAAACATRRR